MSEVPLLLLVDFGRQSPIPEKVRKSGDERESNPRPPGADLVRYPLRYPADMSGVQAGDETLYLASRPPCSYTECRRKCVDRRGSNPHPWCVESVLYPLSQPTDMAGARAKVLTMYIASRSLNLSTGGRGKIMGEAGIEPSPTG